MPDFEVDRLHIVGTEYTGNPTMQILFQELWKGIPLFCDITFKMGGDTWELGRLIALTIDPVDMNKIMFIAHQSSAPYRTGYIVEYEGTLWLDDIEPEMTFW